MQSVGLVLHSWAVVGCGSLARDWTERRKKHADTQAPMQRPHAIPGHFESPVHEGCFAKVRRVASTAVGESHGVLHCRMNWYCGQVVLRSEMTTIGL
ncbi:hypothetical protein F5Y09DRAFT_316420 [Xylaria sp. FL1042]|nr:hypothetical protein F5Y09DRAFT_316420 [Xylaria sp. FL1042]